MKTSRPNIRASLPLPSICFSLYLETLDLVGGEAGGIVDLLEVNVAVGVGLGHGGDVCLLSPSSGLAPRSSLFPSSTTESVLRHYNGRREASLQEKSSSDNIVATIVG